MKNRKSLVWLSILMALSVSSIGLLSLRPQTSNHSSGDSTSPTYPTKEYGVCFHAFKEYTPETKEILANLSNKGMWIRSDWALIQAWPCLHRWESDMRQMGIKVLGVINYFTVTYSSREKADWRDFDLPYWQQLVKKVVTEAPNVPAWEIWNEPNFVKSALGYMDGSPQHYFEMLQSAYNVIKSKSPNSLVIGPALFTEGGGFGMQWLKDIADLGGLNYLDAVSIHLYQGNKTQNQAILSQAKAIVGDKPVWITEIGKPSPVVKGMPSHIRRRPSMSEEEQGAYLKANFDSRTGLQAEVLIWYELQDDMFRAHNPSDPEGYFGLIRTDYTLKPAYYTFKSTLG